MELVFASFVSPCFVRLLLRPASARVWAASYNMLWNKVYASADQALFFGPSRKPRGKSIVQRGCKVYICVEKIYTTRQVVCCTVDEACRSLRVDRPFTITSSVQLFLDQWSLVGEGVSISAYSLPFTSLHIMHEGAGGLPGPRSKIMANFVLSLKGELVPCKAFDLTVSKQPATPKPSKPACSPSRPAPVTEVDAGSDVEFDEGADFDYGMSLLTESVEAGEGKDIQEAAEAAAAASFSESAVLEAEVDQAAIQEMVQNVTAGIDEDLAVMRAVEEEMLQKAVSEKSVSVDDIQASVDKYCAEGMSPDEAVHEAVLNSIRILGNTEQTQNEDDVRATSSAMPEAGGVEAAGMSSQQQKRLAFTKFCTELTRSIHSILQSLHQHAVSTPCEQCSLVLSPVEVQGPPSFQSSRRLLLVSWDVAGRTGRVARVDSEWRLISMVCVGPNRHARNFQNCTVILPSCELAMERVRKKDRQALPEHVVRMAEMFMQCERLVANAAERELQQHSGSPEQWVNVVHAADECVYCGCLHCSASASSEESASTQVPEQCPLCLLHWHQACSEKFVEQYAPVVLKPPELAQTEAAADTRPLICHLDTVLLQLFAA